MGGKMPDNYLRKVISAHTPNIVAAKQAVNTLMPIVSNWGGSQIVKSYYSGSLAKGTGVSPGTDADVFISLSSNINMALKEIYNSLYDAFTRGKQGIGIRKQNVSIGIDFSGVSIDFVPGKRQSQHGNDHSLYKSKSDTWIKTDVFKHIDIVKDSKRQEEIKILKIWRNINKLTFPSFYLEMASIEALKNKRYGELANNTLEVLKYLRDSIQTVTFYDPSNSNNKISDDCTTAEKKLIADTAALSLSKKQWNDIVR